MQTLLARLSFLEKVFVQGKKFTQTNEEKKKKKSTQSLGGWNKELQPAAVPRWSAKEEGNEICTTGIAQNFLAGVELFNFHTQQLFFFLTFFNGYNLYESGTRGAMHTTKHSKLFQCPALQYQIN